MSATDEREWMREVGRRLRAVRHRAGLSLAQVETKSEGRWKAGIVGSYERAARRATIDNLAALTAWYGADLSEILPTGLPAVVVSRETAMALPHGQVQTLTVRDETIFVKMLTS